MVTTDPSKGCLISIQSLWLPSRDLCNDHFLEVSSCLLDRKCRYRYGHELLAQWSALDGKVSLYINISVAGETCFLRRTQRYVVWRLITNRQVNLWLTSTSSDKSALNMISMRLSRHHVLLYTLALVQRVEISLKLFKSRPATRICIQSANNDSALWDKMYRSSRCIFLDVKKQFPFFILLRI